MARSVDLMQGTLNLLILKALSADSTHGWGLSARIAQLSRDFFSIGQGSLYPAVHRLEKRGWITSYWRTTENNRIARYYELTPDGRRALDAEIEAWRKYSRIVDLVIDAG